MTRFKRFLTWAVAPMLAAAMVQPAAAEDLDFMHGRISFADGGGLIKGLNDDEWSYATLNTLVLPGDTIWADQEGSVETELPGGSFLRMADGSRAEIMGLDPNIHIRGWTGSFYLQRVSRSAGDFIFETPAGQITVDANSQVRVDIVGEGSTTVSVRWGRAFVSVGGQAAPVTLSEGQRVYIDPGMLPSAAVPFDRTQEDAFDVWNRERAKLLAVGYSSVPIRTTEKVLGVSDLNNYGEWVYVDREPYWRPTVVVDYVPYRVGHWSYAPTYGYSWVGHYPFSYVTSHYGRWTYHNHYGWLWGYRPGWSGAWVASVRYGPNFVWTPIDFYGRPVYYGGAHFSVGGTRFGLYSSSYCVAGDLFLGPAAVYPVRPTIFHGVPHRDIHIWNINVNLGRHRYGRDILPGVNLPVRDYTPRRVIRGPDVAGPRMQPARTRIATLESASPRVGFDRARTVDAARSARTPIAPAERGAQVRTARVRDADLQQTRDAVRRVLGQEQDGTTITGRGDRTIRASGPEGAVRDATGARSSVRTGDRSVAPADRLGTRATRAPGVTDGPAADGVTVRSGTARERVTTPGVQPDAAVRTPARSGVSVGAERVGAERGARRDGDQTGITSPRTTAPTARGQADRATTPRTTPRAETRAATPAPTAPSRTPSAQPRTEPRVTTPAPSAPSRTPSAQPRTEPRVTTPAPTAPSRTPSAQPRSEPRVTTPAPSAPSRTPAAQPRSEPRVTTPAPSAPSRTPAAQPRSEPRVSAPTPAPRAEPRATSPQQRTSPRSQLQERTVAPRVATPSRQASQTPAPTPSVRTPAPAPSAPRSTVRSAPQVSSPAPSVRSTPPARSSAPSFSAPAPSSRSSAPSVSAPAPSSRSSAPRVSAPAPSSRSSAPSFSAPAPSSRSSAPSVSSPGSSAPRAPSMSAPSAPSRGAAPPSTSRGGSQSAPSRGSARSR
jgi:hypothetical protein